MFLVSTKMLVAEKGTTDFTVQEVVDRSKQSLRSFYQHFVGKNELLLALLEDAMAQVAAGIQEVTAAIDDPLERLRLAVDTLYEQSNPAPSVQRQLFTEFGLQLLVTHPAQVSTASLPLLTVFTELIEHAAADGAIPVGRPRRQAALVMQTVMFATQGNSHAQPLTAVEVWQFCLGGITGGTPRATDVTAE